jgi:DNA (cytosine-5)-methyltransferase 1
VKVAIFVDGCFWHGCRLCGSIPTSNIHYWKQKISRTMGRDKQQTAQLRARGWTVIRLWEHDLRSRNVERAVRMIKKILARKREMSGKLLAQKNMTVENGKAQQLANKRRTKNDNELPFLDFFAGCGLVSEGLQKYFRAVWANDISEKKAAIYRENFGNDHFSLGKIEDVSGKNIPDAVLAWASFPCQDLSLAGQIAGIHGNRSGLVWEWLRVIDEMGERRPPILVAENVAGLVRAKSGADYQTLHQALAKRDYRSGAIELDAISWLPQSRPRIFVVSVRKDFDIEPFVSRGPNWAHSAAVARTSVGLDDFVWWKLPKPPARTTVLSDVIDFDTPCHDQNMSRKTLALIPPHHKKRLAAEQSNGFTVAPGYKRMRNGRQVLELRFDNVSGCLRTPEGGSSRQFLVLKRPHGKFATRLLTVREAARLMGLPDRFKITGSYNDGYRAMGDAVAVPVVRFLARHLLYPLANLSPCPTR